MSQSLTKNNMQYVRLGKSGLKVSRIILGCLGFGDPAWEPWVVTEDESITVIKAAYDAGINTFDTADCYSNGESERILGRAIKKLNLPREEIVVMTKIFLVVTRDTSEPPVLGDEARVIQGRYINQHGLGRKHIFDAVKRSLERLQLDYIDLLQCHRFDNETPIEETMEALHDVVKAGYVRYIGMSTCWAWQFHKMQNYAISNRLTPFISMQIQHSAAYREDEREMMPLLKDLGVGCMPWSPLSQGFLAKPLGTKTTRTERCGKWLLHDPRVTPDAVNDYEASPMLATINRRIEEIARRKGASMGQVAIAWSLSKDFIHAPIVGTTTLENLQDLVGAVHVELTSEEVAYIDEPYQPRRVLYHL